MKYSSIAPKAYQLYLVQMKAKLEHAEEVFFAGEELSSTVIADAKIDFHTLKGGAGFFGLQEIADAAGKIEDLLTSPALSPATAKEEVRPLLRTLNFLAQPLIDEGNSSE